MTALDISPNFRFNRVDAKIVKRVLPHEGTPQAIKTFERYCHRLTDYGYWYLLGTLWVNYTGWSELETWKRLFGSNRPGRQASLMKPSELTVLAELPPQVVIYRAHRPQEKDWIAYTLHPQKAALFACQRDVDRVSEYLVHKADILALFLRHGEFEVLVLDKGKAVKRRDVHVFQVQTSDV